jgi:DNA-binding transcriptional regulator YhcF (GntR family)
VKEIEANPHLSLRKIADIAKVAPNTVKKVKEVIDKAKGILQ